MPAIRKPGIGRLIGRPTHQTTSRSRARLLRIEPLNQRIVLSGLPELYDGVETDPALAWEATEWSVAAADSDISQHAPDAPGRVWQSSDGVVHVFPSSQTVMVVVREFINYRRQAVVEVELAERWTQFAADTVGEVHVQCPSGDLRVEVADGVTKSVVTMEAQTVDHGPADQFGDGVVPGDAESEGPVATTTMTATSTTIESEPAPPPPGGSEEPPEESVTTLTPPEIVDFGCQVEFNQWLFAGRVIDDKPVEGLVVRFGGLLSGRTAVVSDDGIFELFVELPPNSRGYVSARVTDTDNLESEPVFLLIA
jgi:hypothetical protein